MILINKPMPKCCIECFACDVNKDYPFCTITFAGYPGMNFNKYLERMPSCPLIDLLAEEKQITKVRVEEG